MTQSWPPIQRRSTRALALLSGPDSALHVASFEQPLPTSPWTDAAPGPGAPEVTQARHPREAGEAWENLQRSFPSLFHIVMLRFISSLQNINGPLVTCKA